MIVTYLKPIMPVAKTKMLKKETLPHDEPSGSVLVEQRGSHDLLRVRGKYSLSRAAMIILEEIVKDMPKARAIEYLAMLSANAVNESSAY